MNSGVSFHGPAPFDFFSTPDSTKLVSGHIDMGQTCQVQNPGRNDQYYLIGSDEGKEQYFIGGKKIRCCIR